VELSLVVAASVRSACGRVGSGFWGSRNDGKTGAEAIDINTDDTERFPDTVHGQEDRQLRGQRLVEYKWLITERRRPISAENAT
jgi:hypothetical protein